MKQILTFIARFANAGVLAVALIGTGALMPQSANAQVEFYFCAPGSTNKLLSDIDTGPNWFQHYDIVVENTSSSPVVFNAGSVLVGYATATSVGPSATPIAGTDLIDLFSLPPVTSITGRAAWFIGANLNATPLAGGRGPANGVARPYGMAVGIDMGIGSTRTIPAGGKEWLFRVKVKDNGCYGNAPYHDLVLYDGGTGISYCTALVNGGTVVGRNTNWQANRLRIHCGTILPPSFWRVAAVGDPAPGLGQTITALNPPVYSDNGRLGFNMRVTGTNSWATWRNGSPWQGVAGPYSQQAAINDMGRVAVVNPTLAPTGLLTVDWLNWSLPATFLSNFDDPQIPSYLPATVAYLYADTSAQGVYYTTAGTSTMNPYFTVARPFPGYVSLVAVRDYDLTDWMDRGIFEVTFFGPRRGIVVDDASPGSEVVLAVVGDPSGIGSTTWTNVWSPVINSTWNTAFCASTNGPASQDRFLMVNGAVGLKEGDVVDGISLAGFEPVDLDMSNDGFLVHVWQSGSRKVLFCGNVSSLLDSRMLLDTAAAMNLECSPTTISDIKGRPAIGRLLNIAVLATVGGVDTIIRTTNVCLADFNGDCSVDVGDFALLSAAYGSSAGGGGWNSQFDLNIDGTIDIGDYAIFSSVFGSTPP